jgi:hypothetical protein
MITDPVVGAEVQSMRVYVDTLKDELKEKTDENVRCDSTPSFALPNVCLFLSLFMPLSSSSWQSRLRMALDEMQNRMSELTSLQQKVHFSWLLATTDRPLLVSFPSVVPIVF